MGNEPPGGGNECGWCRCGGGVEKGEEGVLIESSSLANRS
jgi:hypothetical protein